MTNSTTVIIRKAAQLAMANGIDLCYSVKSVKAEYIRQATEVIAYENVMSFDNGIVLTTSERAAICG